MRPEVWGPHAWMFLHSITLEYPEKPTIEDKKNMIDFINSLGKVLPCHKCRNNFKTHLQKYPLDDNALASRNNLVKWLIDIHNCVNGVKNCKKLSYEEALEKLLKTYNGERDNLWWLYLLIFIVFILIVLFLFLL